MIQNMIQKTEWENFFSNNKATEWYPSEAVVRFLCSYRKEHGSSGAKFLDLGCGNGRHVWLAAKEGFTPYGIDLSEQAIKLAKEWMARDGLSYADLRHGSIADPLPYADNFFDIAVSYGVLDHMVIAEARRALQELLRVLKPGGAILLKLESNTSFTFDSSRQFAKNEIILEKKVEKGMVQHFFDRDEVVALVRDFVLVRAFREDLRRFDDLEKNDQSRWIFIGKKP